SALLPAPLDGHAFRPRPRRRSRHLLGRADAVACAAAIAAAAAAAALRGLFLDLAAAAGRRRANVPGGAARAAAAAAAGQQQVQQRRLPSVEPLPAAGHRRARPQCGAVLERGRVGAGRRAALARPQRHPLHARRDAPGADAAAARGACAIALPAARRRGRAGGRRQRRRRAGHRVQARQQQARDAGLVRIQRAAAERAPPDAARAAAGRGRERAAHARARGVGHRAGVQRPGGAALLLVHAEALLPLQPGLLRRARGARAARPRRMRRPPRPRRRRLGQRPQICHCQEPVNYIERVRHTLAARLVRAHHRCGDQRRSFSTRS
ncbi:MAG: hypothetical protein J3K34DRAFT_505144, partial [Monoraphidium minutum]